MTERAREPRFGLSTYQLRVSREISPSGILYVRADSLTVTPAGAVILSMEVSPIEDYEELSDGEVRLRENASGIDVEPGVVIASGYWYSAIEVDPEHHVRRIRRR